MKIKYLMDIGFKVTLQANRKTIRVFGTIGETNKIKNYNYDFVSNKNYYYSRIFEKIMIYDSEKFEVPVKGRTIIPDRIHMFTNKLEEAEEIIDELNEKIVKKVE